MTIKIVEKRPGGMREFYNRMAEFFAFVFECIEQEEGTLEEKVTKCVDKWLERKKG